MSAVIEGAHPAVCETVIEGMIAPESLSTPESLPANAEPKKSSGPAINSTQDVISRIGQMTRTLHDTLRELGYDKTLENAAAAIPDARDRLAYVASLTEKAAERVLSAAEVARPLQDSLEAGANGLTPDWDRFFERGLPIDEFTRLAERTRDFLAELPKSTRATSAQLMEIVMAQDFQDLTGQVIKKITQTAQQLEQQMVQLLLDAAPPAKRAEAGNNLMNGPVIKAEGRNDVVTSQDQVDDLLESLGF